MSKVTHLTLDEGGGLSRKRIHLREISGEADAPLDTVGQDLRTGRLRRGDDLATVSKALKIRKDHLEALEEDRFDSLPGRTYAIGFVRSYAEYLGLDPVDAVERFKGEIAGRDDGPRRPVFQEEEEERRLPHGWFIIAVVLLGLVIYGAYRLARFSDSMINAPVAAVPARIAPPAEKPALRTVPPPAAPAAPAATPPSAVAPAAGGVAGGQAQTGTPSGAPAAAPSQTTLADTVKALPKGTEYGLRNKGARVVLRVLRPTRVLVQGPGANPTTFINRVLQPGDSYRVPDFVGLTLTTQDAGAVAFELDGQMMGRAGQGKQIAEAQSLDPQSIVDRYNRKQLP